MTDPTCRGPLFRRWLFVFAVSAAALASTLDATTLVPLDIAELASRARVIARGSVVDVRPEWAPGRRLVRTRVTIALSEYLKGDTRSPVTLIVPGGRMGRYRSIMVGAPHFDRGETVIVFLAWQDPSAPYLVGFSQGVFRVVHDTAGRRDLVTPRPLLATGGSPEPVKRGDPDRPLLELIEFRTLVRDLVAGRTR